jgi:phospholipid/cholesterol/gamma-HCH transport system substrate-binding protein
MESTRQLSIVVGAFVLLSLAALVVTILALSSQQGAWRDRYNLEAYFPTVAGLVPNAPVWLAGTPVGRVDSVAFAAGPDGTPLVRVGLQVDRAVSERIREDSVASIGVMGLLGDRYVGISLGTGEREPLAPGARIETLAPTDLYEVIDQGGDALRGISALATTLNGVVGDFQKETGGKELPSSVAAIATIVDEIQNGDGLLHSFIYDEYEGGGIESIERSLASFEAIMNEVTNGEGVLHSLIYDRLTEQDLVLEALGAGAKLNSILEKVDAGQGTLGLLVNDPTLYGDLKLLVGGAQRSAVVRTLIRLSSEEETNQ